MVLGAVLVAVPDPRADAFPSEASSFGQVPRSPLPFPALMVASSNDPFSSLDYSREVAHDWGASHMSVGPLGHINAGSGLGAWDEGQRLLRAFVAGL